MAAYAKKISVVDAHRYTYTGEFAIKRLCDFIGTPDTRDGMVHPSTQFDPVHKWAVRIHLPNGELITLRDGEWLVKNRETGALTQYGDAAFRAEYEPAVGVIA